MKNKEFNVHIIIMYTGRALSRKFHFSKIPKGISGKKKTKICLVIVNYVFEKQVGKNPQRIN